ncbi:hypothetical protein [Mycobacterium genavense]|uniref:hypothetical protein n=1 Tax=Mycobacterium genavense TaxID=36812 RepID=UPI00046FB06C|nr:hypothetical protein [Mycobacterium genavense]
MTPTIDHDAFARRCREFLDAHADGFGVAAEEPLERPDTIPIFDSPERSVEEQQLKRARTWQRALFDEGLA